MRHGLKTGDSVKFMGTLRLVVVEVLATGLVRCLDAEHRIDEYPAAMLEKY